MLSLHWHAFLLVEILYSEYSCDYEIKLYFSNQLAFMYAHNSVNCQRSYVWHYLLVMTLLGHVVGYECLLVAPYSLENGDEYAV